MTLPSIKTSLAAGLALAFAAPAAFAQSGTTAGTTTGYGSSAAGSSASTGSTSMGSGLRMPYQRDFWGHVGASLGRSQLDIDCLPGTECDDKDRVLRVFGGGRFNNTFGGEIAWMDFGDFAVGGGQADTQALDLAVIAGFPFANNWSVFGKLGAVYARSDVSANVAGIESGERNGWGPRVGVGLQMGLNENWALRADLDRYRIRLPGGRENVDTFMLGAQYTFR
jgi:opacity protein-like surface antigen